MHAKCNMFQGRPQKIKVLTIEHCGVMEKQKEGTKWELRHIQGDMA